MLRPSIYYSCVLAVLQNMSACTRETEVDKIRMRVAILKRSRLHAEPSGDGVARQTL